MNQDQGNPEVAATIRPQRNSLHRGNNHPSSSKKMIIQQMLLGYCASVILLKVVSPTLGYVAIFLTTLIFLCGLISPDFAYKKIETFLKLVTDFIATIITWITLVTLFYCFFAPFHYFFRTKKRDTLQRFYDPSAQSYWVTRSNTNNRPSHYERLF